ncbi:hypothetical protein GGTG_04637 [Gaeumannomyces tritici R3-111a-1]|uniref:CN hydrolase domain-containing protein n=1 Tax=Gaeumannomyces tritici (strain R3-111a-1) TaxID=644352 RepID=J3NTN7_GAET3|nr:hypothetical protein GGTG_04637 [Gaeumannomyces tritici R3-111a-1]EJT79552.1 hypothetical protein GGTG_04637 [Gaeumannomyces tritici R3-111a-1]
MEHNLQQCVQLVKEASAAGAKVLFLPEASDYIAENREQSLALARPESSSLFVLGLQAAAREHGVDVNVGIHVSAPAPASDGTNQRLLDRTIHITGSSGTIDARGTYDKLHLFDYGALRESAHTAAGAALTPPFDTPVGRVGAQTCFDLRFPEPALTLARWGDPRPRRPGAGGPAQVLTHPSAFTVPTGLAHWEVLLLLRARAPSRRSASWSPPPRSASTTTGRAGRQGQLRAQHGRRSLGAASCAPCPRSGPAARCPRPRRRPRSASLTSISASGSALGIGCRL